MIRLDVWLYGPLAKYAGAKSQGSFAQLAVELADGGTMRDLLTFLGFPLAEKGITFINGALTDMPGLLTDLDRVLADGDRVALLHQLSMWPCQYRIGAAIGPELKQAMKEREGGSMFNAAANPPVPAG